MYGGIGGGKQGSPGERGGGTSGTKLYLCVK